MHFLFYIRYHINLAPGPDCRARAQIEAKLCPSVSKGHPLGATGLAQCCELTWQLRGDAEKRQVEDARVALQHNLGLGGAAVVTLYRKGTID